MMATTVIAETTDLHSMANRVSDSPERSYEQAFARVIPASFAIGFSHARTALCAIFRGLGLQPGEEVVLSPLTCKVVPLALLSMGVVPRYGDISLETLNLSSSSIRSLVSQKTRALLFQHTYGLPEGRSDAAAAAQLYGIHLVEDCAQSMPPFRGDIQEGICGIAAIFSNNFLKPIPAGSGGIAATNDPDLAHKIIRSRNRYPLPTVWEAMKFRLEELIHQYGLRPHRYWFFYELNKRINSGYQNRPLEKEIADQITLIARRLTPYQCRNGLQWINRLDDLAQHRMQCCREYLEGLRGQATLSLPRQKADIPLYYFPVLVPAKEELLKKARSQKLEIIAWPLSTPIYPIEQHEHLAAYGYKLGCCPQAEWVASRLVGLPTHPHIHHSHRKQIIELVLESS